MRRLVFAPSLALALAALAGCNSTPDQTGANTGHPAVGGPFQLIDQNGRPVTQAALVGKPSWCSSATPSARKCVRRRSRK